MFGDQFKMMGVETPVKQEMGSRVEGGHQVTTGKPADLKVEEGSLAPRKEMLLMLASTVGEDSGAGLLSEQEPSKRTSLQNGFSNIAELDTKNNEIIKLHYSSIDG